MGCLSYGQIYIYVLSPFISDDLVHIKYCSILCALAFAKSFHCFHWIALAKIKSMLVVIPFRQIGFCALTRNQLNEWILYETAYLLCISAISFDLYWWRKCLDWFWNKKKRRIMNAKDWICTTDTEDRVRSCIVREHKKKVFDVMDKACEKWNENVSTMHPISTHSCSVLIRRSTDKIEKGWNYIWFASHTWLLATINLWRSMLGVGVSLGGSIRRHTMCIIQCIIFQYATLAFWR